MEDERTETPKTDEEKSLQNGGADPEINTDESQAKTDEEKSLQTGEGEPESNAGDSQVKTDDEKLSKEEEEKLEKEYTSDSFASESSLKSDKKGIFKIRTKKTVFCIRTIFWRK